MNDVPFQLFDAGVTGSASVYNKPAPKVLFSASAHRGVTVESRLVKQKTNCMFMSRVRQNECRAPCESGAVSKWVNVSVSIYHTSTHALVLV